MRSFDAPRRRSAPASFTGVTLSGEASSHTFRGITLVVAVKPQCDGCRDFVNATLEEFASIELVIVSATGDGDGEWAQSHHPILIAPTLMEQLDVRWPPFYVVIDAATSEIVSEGVVFGAAQVAEEIATFLT
ncbi:MAG: hypothetical protein ACYC0I_00585 [Acidimicrobiales bacterium]